MKKNHPIFYVLIVATIIVMVAILNSSCTKIPCKFDKKIRSSKNLRHQRMVLRTKYKYHQTKIGKFINFNKL